MKTKFKSVSTIKVRFYIFHLWLKQNLWMLKQKHCNKLTNRKFLKHKNIGWKYQN